MLENSPEFNVVGQDHSSSSVPRSISNEEPKTSKEDNFNLVEAIYRSILDELIDDATLEVCFEIHRTTKLSLAEKNSKCTKKPQMNIVRCSICCNSICAEKFARHLEYCMGAFTNKRKASQKIISFEESEGSSDDYSDSEDFVPGGSKKKSKKGSRSKSKQPRPQGNSSEINSNYKNMTHEEKSIFFNQNCGVLSKRTKRLCTKTLNCSQHTDEQRKDIRNELLSVRDINEPQFSNMVIDQSTSEEVIDVDTIDVEDISPQLTLPS